MRTLLLLLSIQLLCNICSCHAFTDTSVDFGKKHFIVGYKADQSDKPIESAHLTKKDKNTPSTTSYFTSIHDVRKELQTCLQKAHKTICIATFALTDKNITNQLIKAHQAGIKVTVITDKEKMRERHSKINTLVAHGIPVYYYNTTLNPNIRQQKAKNALMHHKFIVIDDETLIFGSLNLTKAGQEENIENITVTTKAQMVTHYLDEFNRLLLLSTRVTPTLFF